MIGVSHSHVDRRNVITWPIIFETPTNILSYFSESSVDNYSITYKFVNLVFKVIIRIHFLKRPSLKYVRWVEFRAMLFSFTTNLRLNNNYDYILNTQQFNVLYSFLCRNISKRIRTNLRSAFSLQLAGEFIVRRSVCWTVAWTGSIVDFKKSRQLSNGENAPRWRGR